MMKVFLFGKRKTIKRAAGEVRTRRSFWVILLLPLLLFAPVCLAHSQLMNDEGGGKENNTTVHRGENLSEDPVVLETLVAPTLSAIEAGDIVFNVFMNPPRNLFQVNFTGTRAGNFEVDFVEAGTGRKNVILKSSGEKNRSVSVQFNGNEQDIKKGAYYIVVRDGSHSYVKKIIFY